MSAMAWKAYTVLGVAPGATVAEIKTASRERARQIHPDRFADDPRRAQAAHRAFVELSEAFRAALAASAATVPGLPERRPAPSVPAQRRTVPTQRSAPAPTPAAPRPTAPRRPTVVPRESDPMLTLLTVPQRCARPWSAAALELWALTVVPEARRHLSEAKRLARASGVRSERHLSTATAHAVLTLTMNNLNGPRVIGVVGHLDLAYDAFEIVLPREVVDRLPARITARRPADDDLQPEPGKRLLAFCAASGALAAATLWTGFFGFFGG